MSLSKNQNMRLIRLYDYQLHKLLSQKACLNLASLDIELYNLYIFQKINTFTTYHLIERLLGAPHSGHL